MVHVPAYKLIDLSGEAPSLDGRVAQLGHREILYLGREPLLR